MCIIFAYFLDALSFDLFFINSKENIAVFKNTLSSALAAGPRRPPGNGSDGIGPSPSKKRPDQHGRAFFTACSDAWRYRSWRQA